MKPVRFPEVNVTYAEDQPQYIPLPVYKPRHDSEGRVVSCWQMTWRERFSAFFGGKVWLTQLTFGRSLQPVCLDIEKPIEPMRAI
jgi:uncharacterized membrane protein YagU involved in acid resistance